MATLKVKTIAERGTINTMKTSKQTQHSSLKNSRHCKQNMRVIKKRVANSLLLNPRYVSNNTNGKITSRKLN